MSKALQVKRIVSHLPPRHLDDWLCLCLALNKWPDAEVVFVHPQEVSEEMKEDPTIVLIDCGGDFDPQKRNYDHHQDRDLYCSFILFAIHELEMPIFTKWGLTIDTIDRFGFTKAQELYGVKPDKEMDLKRRIILQTKITFDIAKKVSNYIVERAQDNCSYDVFLNGLFFLLDGMKEFDEARDIIEKEIVDLENKIRSVIVTQAGNFNVGISYKTLAPYHSKVFDDLCLDILIERNSLNPEHTSFIVNTKSMKVGVFEFRDVLVKELNSLGINEVFRHHTGFIVVMDVPIEDILGKGNWRHWFDRVILENF